MTSRVQLTWVLDSSSPLPLYHQLAEVLFAQIRAGAYVPGHKIPSEHALAASYGVGRPTVRQATDALIQRGVLVRKRGSGTFVRSVPIQVDLFSLAGTLVSFERTGVAWSSRVLGRAQLHHSTQAEHPFAGRACLRVERLSRVDATPVLLEEIDFDPEVFPGLGQESLQGRSLSEVVEQRYRLRPIAADQNFRVTVLDLPRAERLELPSGTPILQVDRTLHFTRGEAAVFARMFCRTDRLVFSQRIMGHNYA